MILLLLTLLACGGECPGGDMVASEGGLVVAASEHPTGWGNPDCTECHALVAIHRTSCGDDVDLLGVREIVATDGVAACSECHGDNGVAQ